MLELRLWLTVLAAPAFTCPALAAEPWEGVYEGAIGQSRIIVELASEGARYAYLNRPNDLGLMVIARGNTLTLTETLAPGLEAEDVKANPRLVSGRWTLRQEGEKLNGTWTNAAGASQHPINLIRVASRTDPADAPRKPGGFGAYAARWLATAPQFVPLGGEASIGPLSYTMVRDDLFGNSLPRLTRAPAGVRMDGVNNLLQNLHRKLVLADRNCVQELRRGAAALDLAQLKTIDGRKQNPAQPTSQVELKLVYGSPTLLSVLETRTAFCGGAHPNTSMAAYTFDLANPRQISALGSDDQPSDDLGTSALGSALNFVEPADRARFDAMWVSKMRAAIQTHQTAQTSKADAQTDAACATAIDGDLAEKGGAIEKIAYPLPEGLAIRISGFPQVIAVCASDFAPNPVIVPWREVKPFLKPAQKIFPPG